MQMMNNNVQGPNFKALIIKPEVEKSLSRASAEMPKVIRTLREQLANTKKFDLEVGMHDDMFVHRIVNKTKTKAFGDIEPFCYEGGKSVYAHVTQVSPFYSVTAKNIEFATKEEAKKGLEILVQGNAYNPPSTYSQVLLRDANRVSVLENSKFE